jgi:short-subunit dehydrogenase
MAVNKTTVESGMTALVTGASSGIGEQFARQLADRGVDLVLVARHRQRLEDLSAELRSGHDGLPVIVYTVDLAEPTGAQELVDRLAANDVIVDLLINNAGVGSYGSLADEQPDRIAREILLDCLTPVALTRLLLPGMLARGRGGVINVASAAGFQPIPTQAVYAASKAFVISFTEALWAETEPSAIRVLALCPGPTETRFFETANPNEQFLTRGRQSPEQVVEFALNKFDHTGRPTIVPGTANRILASGYRIMPRAVMPHVALRRIRA